jgi:hypothetical protein
MKRIAFILMTAILLAGGAVVVMSAPSYAQDYEYPPPPQDPYASPWVGPDTPWVYYNGDWFLNGTLYYFFGPEYGWAPYYAYPPNYILTSETWYAPRWLTWYQRQPQYWTNFQRQYPYWRGHRQGRHYSQKFYEQHHHSQGSGWHKGFQGGSAAASRAEGRKPRPAQVAPSEKQQQMQHEQKLRKHEPAVQHEKKLQKHEPAMQHEQKLQQHEPAVQHEQQPQQHQQQQQGGDKEKQ